MGRLLGGDASRKSSANNVNLERDFATSTTCHGMSFWYTSTSTIARIFWIFLVTGMTFALISQVISRIVAYMEFKTSTDISENFVSYLDFPAVTVCSFNRYFVKNANDMQLKFIHTINHMTTSSYAAHAAQYGLEEDETVMDAMSERFNFTRFADIYGLQLREKTAMPACRFKSGFCSHEDFKPIITSFGKCHTFNEGKAGYRIQNIPGSGNGLVVVLNAKQYDYTEEPLYGIAEAGMKVQIHPPYEAPDMETFGVAVPVGQKAYIEIHRIDNNLLYEPWGRCDPSKEKLKYFDKYTLHNCIQECYTDAVISHCGCRVFTQYWAAHVALECTISEMYECASKYVVSMKQEYSAADCNCTIPCNFTNYGMSVTYSTFPGYTTSSYMEKYWNISEDYTERNLLKFEVYFGSMSYKIFTQSKKIDESALLSEIGGQLGLWVGMSCITLVEFLQYFVKKLHYCRRRDLKDAQAKKTRVSSISDVV